MDSSAALRSDVAPPPLLVVPGPHGVVTLKLNRPEFHNAFDETLLRDMTQTLESYARDPDCRMVVLMAEGPTFCAGLDLLWMERTVEASEEAHRQDAQAMVRLLKAAYHFPKPLVALTQGAVVGLGVGLLACCDIVVASDSTLFRLSDVKVGLVPAIVAPYVVKAMGVRVLHRYILTGEPFSATEAKHLGLVHEIVPDRMLEAAAQKLTERLVSCGPQAQQAAKALLRHLGTGPVDEETTHYTTALTAHLRASEEGREGYAAYAEKRPPSWLAT